MMLDASPARERLFLRLGALSALAAVGLGAFGAHGLRGLLPGARLEIFETAVRYHLFHSLAVVVAALVSGRRWGRAAPAAGWLFLLGIVLFSGSLYLRALTGAQGWGWLAPLGGLAWLLGWAALAASGWTSRSLLVEIPAGPPAPDEEVRLEPPGADQPAGGPGAVEAASRRSETAAATRTD